MIMNFFAPASSTLKRAWFHSIRGLRLAMHITVFVLIAAPTLAATYKDNGDGPVTDASTGLSWMRCAIGQLWTGSTCMATATAYLWPYAYALTGAVSFAGHNDWRLPNVRELQTILDRSKYSPAIDAATFPNTPATPFWSATDYAGVPSAAWYVHFGDGYVGSVLKLSANPAQVRLVRGVQSSGALNLARPSSDYVATADGTVTHTPTRLMGKRCAEGATVWHDMHG